MKKLEPNINTVSPVMTYLFRCNTDVTCLKSGTAMKAVIMYVTNYVTKTALKTHVIFDSIKAMFEKNSELLSGTRTSREKAKSLMVKVVNNLTAKMELGSSMISLYLLGNPDHYKSHQFNTILLAVICK